MPWGQVERMLAGVRLEAMTDRSVTDLEVFARQLERVRRLGYAAFRGESEEGAASIAMTVRDATGRVVSALNVAAPAVRMDRARQDRMLVDLRNAAVRLEEALREFSDADLPQDIAAGVVDVKSFHRGDDA